MTPEEFDALPMERKRSVRAKLSECGKAACEYCDMGLAVIPLLDGTKKPAIEGWQAAQFHDWELACWYWSEHPGRNVGIVTGTASGIVVVDVDQNEAKQKYGADSLEEWEQENAKLPETVCSMTANGGTHHLFRTDTKVERIVNQMLNIDILGEKSYFVAPPSRLDDGGAYTWDLDPWDNDIAPMDGTVLSLIAYVASTRPASSGGGDGRYEFPETVHDGEGREQHLLTLAYSLRSQGRERSEIEQELQAVNQARVIPPKPIRDIKRIARSVCKKPAGLSPEYRKAKERAERRRAEEAERAAEAFERSVAASREAGAEPEAEPIDPSDFKMGRNGLDHAKVGSDMVERFHARKIDGVPSVWVGGRYETGWDAVRRLVGRYKFSAKESERNEVVRWLDLNMPQHRAGDWKLVTFLNGTVNIETLELVGNSPDFNVPNVIPHRWNPDASSSILDETLDGIACHDPNVVRNLHEVMGMSMCRDTAVGKAFFIINSSGANGKSTFINFVRGLVGEDNCSGVDIQTMGERFQSTPLMGKLANIADDIPSDIASNSSLSTFKKVVTGDWTQYEVKGGAIGTFRPYCTCIFSMNKMPPLGDSTGGMMRRIHPIPFTASFRDGEADRRRGEHLATEEAYEAAAVLGIKAMRDVVARGDVTKTRYSIETLAEIELTNNQVAAFLDEEGWTRELLTMKPCRELYEGYSEWADGSGIRNKFTSRRFNAEVRDLMGMETRKASGGNGGNVYRFM